MELPRALRDAVERELAGTLTGDLKHASATLSRRYRAETRDGRLHLGDALAVKAYLAARLPATYAAVRASLGAVAVALPGYAPATLLDLGAGPGTVLWAAHDCWPGLAQAMLVEASAEARHLGASLARDADLPGFRWIDADIGGGLRDIEPADLVTLSYVLDELPPGAIAPLVARLWALTTGVLLIVEPGTPAGWTRIVQVRDILIRAGATIAAPCPHDAPCPLAAPDWCHFSRRVARSRLHRLTKNADVPWEDEKYSFVAATGLPVATRISRVLAPRRQSKGQVQLKLCQVDGSVGNTLVTQREGLRFKAARRLDWGDRAELD